MQDTRETVFNRTWSRKDNSGRQKSHTGKKLKDKNPIQNPKL